MRMIYMEYGMESPREERSMDYLYSSYQGHVLGGFNWCEDAR